jgi:hypothetical protein
MLKRKTYVQYVMKNVKMHGLHATLVIDGSTIVVLGLIKEMPRKIMNNIIAQDAENKEI